MKYRQVYMVDHQHASLARHVLDHLAVERELGIDQLAQLTALSPLQFAVGGYHSLRHQHMAGSVGSIVWKAVIDQPPVFEISD